VQNFTFIKLNGLFYVVPQQTKILEEQELNKIDLGKVHLLCRGEGG
jgi:hypothetical protein